MNNKRFEKANNLLSIFCKDHLADEPLSDRWVNNLKLIKYYSDELVELVRELNE